MLFRCLSERESNNRDIRRPQKVIDVAKVAEVKPSSVIKVVDIFRRQDNCFLTPSFGKSITAETVIDIGHESLIRQWKKVQEWVEDEVKMRDFFKDLGVHAKTWKEYGDGKLLADLHLGYTIKNV